METTLFIIFFILSKYYLFSTRAIWKLGNIVLGYSPGLAGLSYVTRSINPVWAKIFDG